MDHGEDPPDSPSIRETDRCRAVQPGFTDKPNLHPLTLRGRKKNNLYFLFVLIAYVRSCASEFLMINYLRHASVLTFVCMCAILPEQLKYVRKLVFVKYLTFLSNIFGPEVTRGEMKRGDFRPKRHWL